MLCLLLLCVLLLLTNHISLAALERAGMRAARGVARAALITQVCMAGPLTFKLFFDYP